MALQKCHECGKDFSSEAKYCSNCGTSVKPPENIAKQPDKVESSKEYLYIGIFIVFFFCLLIFAVSSVEENNPRRKMEKEIAKYEKQRPEIEKKVFTDNIEGNYQKLLDYYNNKNIGWTKSFIEDFRKYGRIDYKDVATIEKKISDPKYIKEAEALVQKENKLYRIKQRQQLAKQMESDYLSNGLDIKIRLSGPEKTSMRLEYVLFSRPLIHQLTNDTDFFSNLRDAGFKKVVLTDKYRYTWTYDLTK
ncbi:MAG: zinc ribbon domain-containing protein [Bacteroidota bacterium]